MSGTQSKAGSPAQRNGAWQAPVSWPWNLYWPQLEKQPTTFDAPGSPWMKKVSCSRRSWKLLGQLARRSPPHLVSGEFAEPNQKWVSTGPTGVLECGPTGTMSMFRFTPSTTLMSGAELLLGSLKVHSASDFGPVGV